ncbi:hypothetical protein ODS41_05840 [Pyrobaculum sp. 3827-6]|uniref:hypothetical protein n=1 Tax=Pyrobaculum sp. 3827-6 TaxID=2983604 RepID=UPI0021D8F8A5|nr:hypothetical protein [Pyrobaculum sp. 3827-6]MCU7787440.1 hypothetical protein [Pyrobaculum sp. 3827-6]
MIVVNSKNLDKVIWHVRNLLPQIEATPILLASREVGNYVIGLGTLGYIYEALSSVLEVLVEAGKMAGDLGLKEYSLVIGPSESYITTAQLPEVMPPLPPPKPITPLPREEVRLNSFNCRDLAPGMVRFCVDNVEIAYYLAR